MNGHSVCEAVERVGVLGVRASGVVEAVVVWSTAW